MPAPLIRGRFLWHELVTTDPKAAIAFYTKVVGWKTQAWDNMPDYIIWMGKRGPVGGVTPLPTGIVGVRPHWLGYIGTPDLDATVREVVRLDGRIVSPAESVPTVGRMQQLADPQGAIFSAFQPENPMPDDGTMQPGDFTWHELATTDIEAAFRFYQQLFGWEKTSVADLGPIGTYQIFGWGGKSMGGIYRLSPDMPGPPNWLPYAFVPDTAAAARLTPQNGGQIFSGPMQVPGGDWIAMGFDPQGAAFAVHSSAKAKPPAKPARKARPRKAAKAKTASKARSAARARLAKKRGKTGAAKRPRRAKVGKKRR
jgi:predicted enzyme related to lactoylglutathione lyase